MPGCWISAPRGWWIRVATAPSPGPVFSPSRRTARARTGKGKPLTFASDIYSAGVLLYRILTGRPPYRILDEPGAIADTIVHQVPRPPDWMARSMRSWRRRCARVRVNDIRRRRTWTPTWRAICRGVRCARVVRAVPVSWRWRSRQFLFAAARDGSQQPSPVAWRCFPGRAAAYIVSHSCGHWPAAIRLRRRSRPLCGP